MSQSKDVEESRLRLERQKLALEILLKRRELRSSQRPSAAQLLSNPLILAIVGGFLTLMATIISTYLESTRAFELETLKANLESQRDKERLQADLIKAFAEASDLAAARDNLKFLVEAGFLPDYAAGIRQYFADNPESAPRIRGADYVQPRIGTTGCMSATGSCWMPDVSGRGSTLRIEAAMLPRLVRLIRGTGTPDDALAQALDALFEELETRGVPAVSLRYGDESCEVFAVNHEGIPDRERLVFSLGHYGGCEDMKTKLIAAFHKYYSVESHSPLDSLRFSPSSALKDK